MNYCFDLDGTICDTPSKDSKNNFKVGVLNLMGNVFMKKCDDVFIKIEKFLKNYYLKKTKLLQQ